MVTRTGTANSNRQLQTTFTSPAAAVVVAALGFTANRRSTSLSHRCLDYRSALAYPLSVRLFTTATK